MNKTKQSRTRRPPTVRCAPLPSHRRWSKRDQGSQCAARATLRGARSTTGPSGRTTTSSRDACTAAAAFCSRLRRRTHESPPPPDHCCFIDRRKSISDHVILSFCITLLTDPRPGPGGGARSPATGDVSRAAASVARAGGGAGTDRGRLRRALFPMGPFQFDLPISVINYRSDSQASRPLRPRPRSAPARLPLLACAQWSARSRVGVPVRAARDRLAAR